MLFRGVLAGAILLLTAVVSPAFADHARGNSWSGSAQMSGSNAVAHVEPGRGFDHAWRDWRSSRRSHWSHGWRHHLMHPQTVILLPLRRHSRTAIPRSRTSQHLLRPDATAEVVVIDRHSRCCVEIVVAAAGLPHGIVCGHGHAAVVVVVLPSRKPSRIVD